MAMDVQNQIVFNFFFLFERSTILLKSLVWYIVYFLVFTNINAQNLQLMSYKSLESVHYNIVYIHVHCIQCI